MFQILYNIFILPIEYIVEVIFYIMNKIFTGNPGISIMFVSLVVNILILPLYKRADDMQERERDKQKSMERWNKHIQKTFKGDERYMMQTAYYRIEGYKPFYAILGSLSLVFQIPFFIAAYHFLSNLNMLAGAEFLMIKNLSRPDEIIKIGSVAINVLPILMTLINIVSGMIYTKGFKLKDKLQLYIMALLFLVILYKSPSGLVLYWTCNNLFSLGKNVFFKYVKNRKWGLNILSATAGTGLFAVLAMSHKLIERKQYLLFGGIMVASYIPLIVTLLSKLAIVEKCKSLLVAKEEHKKVNAQLFWLGLAFLTLFLGVLVPSALIAPSPVDFGESALKGPLYLIVGTFSTYFGLLIVWIGVFYLISKDNFKTVMTFLMWIFTTGALVNYYAFFGKYGIMNANLRFDIPPFVTDMQKLINMAVLLVVAVIAFLLIKKWPKLIKYIYQVLLVMVVVLSLVNIVKAQKILKEENYYDIDKRSIITPTVPLSKNGKNVVMIMLDRGIGAYVPYIFNEKPELGKKYEDFVFYPNTVSFSGHTWNAAPALYGGYEYTPLKINERDTETLEEKQNEALRILPKLFADEGYEVNVCDPPLAGYQEIADLSIYDGMDGITGHIADSVYWGELDEIYSESVQQRNIFYYSLFRTVPLLVQNSIYDNGDYLGTPDWANAVPECALNYAYLNGLDRYTYVDKNCENSFVMLSSMITHNPSLLENYNYSLDKMSSAPVITQEMMDDIYVVNGRRLRMTDYYDIRHYDVNIATLILLGKWMDYLKAEGIYDNTRIIITADHGSDLPQIQEMIREDGIVTMEFNPILFVKDFADSDELAPSQYDYLGKTKIKESYDFMTNADVPYMLMKGIIDNPVNPYTGNPINNDAKENEPIIITSSEKNHEHYNGETTFDTSDGKWYEVIGGLVDIEEWKVVEP